MKRQGKLICIVFVVVGMLGIAGTAVAEKGGLPQCKADLSICEADFQFCLDTASLITKTGQEQCYASGDDGQLQYGVTCQGERFTDNLDGTVTDNLTGLIWTMNANCKACDWYCAVHYCETLENGFCDLEDGSIQSDWRLPNAREISSLIDYGNSSPPLPAGHPFINVGWDYWTSTTRASSDPYYFNAWYVELKEDGKLSPTGFKFNPLNVWCVKGGM